MQEDSERRDCPKHGRVKPIRVEAMLDTGAESYDVILSEERSRL